MTRDRAAMLGGLAGSIVACLALPDALLGLRNAGLVGRSPATLIIGIVAMLALVAIGAWIGQRTGRDDV